MDAVGLDALFTILTVDIFYNRSSNVYRVQAWLEELVSPASVRMVPSVPLSAVKTRPERGFMMVPALTDFHLVASAAALSQSEIMSVAVGVKHLPLERTVPSLLNAHSWLRRAFPQDDGMPIGVGVISNVHT